MATRAIYAYNGTADQSTQNLYRLDNADVPAASLVSGSGASVQNASAWINVTAGGLSSPSAVGQGICGSQCFYDLVVAVPQGEPDTVVIGGQFNVIGESTMRSTDAGQTWRTISARCAQPREPRGRPRRGVRARRLERDCRRIRRRRRAHDGRFTGGSVNCGTGQLADLCRATYGQVPESLVFMNKGLQTLQFYNVALDPHAPLTRLIGGLQDNSTIWHDTNDPPRSGSPSSNRRRHVGVGLPSVEERRPVREFSEQQLLHEFPERRRQRVGAHRDPIVQSGERTLITASTGRQFLTFDLVNPDTQFTGFQHVWRTRTTAATRRFSR